MRTQDSDFYTNLRSRIDNWLSSDEGRGSEWTDYIMAAPDMLHLLVKLTMEPKVPVTEKAKLGAALAYFVSPFDVIPEALGGPPGLLEDVAIAAYVVNGIVRNSDPSVVRRHWAGNRDLLELIQNVLERADTMLGAAAWRRVKHIVGAE